MEGIARSQSCDPSNRSSGMEAKKHIFVQREKSHEGAQSRCCCNNITEAAVNRFGWQGLQLWQVPTKKVFTRGTRFEVKSEGVSFITKPSQQHVQRWKSTNAFIILDKYMHV